MQVDLDRALLPYAPDWVVAAILIGGAIAIALIVHAVLYRLLSRVVGAQRRLVGALLRRTRGLSRYALVLFALSAVVPLAPLDPFATTVANKVLIAAVILLIGWVVMLCANLTAEHYVGRLQVVAPDDILARKAVTQVEVLKRIVDGVIIVVAIGFALMTFDTVRELGISLFASAGVVGLVAGMALRPALGNFFAGLQLAFTQPIRINDVVTVEGEHGTVEDLSTSFVVIRLWDLRRLIVPLSHFIEKPFQNWTRTSSQILGSVLVYTDYTVPVERIRAKAREIVEASPFWDRQVFNVQVTDLKENSIETRILVSAPNSARAWDLRCELREKLAGYFRQRADSSSRHRAEADSAMGSDGLEQPDQTKSTGRTHKPSAN
jgi:small-conductance mechanosensitive channel